MPTLINLRPIQVLVVRKITAIGDFWTLSHSVTGIQITQKAEMERRIWQELVRRFEAANPTGRGTDTQHVVLQLQSFELEALGFSGEDIAGMMEV